MIAVLSGMGAPHASEHLLFGPSEPTDERPEPSSMWSCYRPLRPNSGRVRRCKSDRQFLHRPQQGVGHVSDFGEWPGQLDILQANEQGPKGNYQLAACQQAPDAEMRPGAKREVRLVL